MRWQRSMFVWICQNWEPEANHPLAVCISGPGCIRRTKMEYGIRLIINMTMATGSTWEFLAKAGVIGNQGIWMLTMVIQCMLI